jgi:hypothetical protein
MASRMERTLARRGGRVCFSTVHLLPSNKNNGEREEVYSYDDRASSETVAFNRCRSDTPTDDGMVCGAPT